MKLLFCSSCSDVFSLDMELKTCSCGKTSGRYTDHLNAEYSGEGVMIGFNNSTFINALRNPGSDFIAFTIKEPCRTFKKTDR